MRKTPQCDYGKKRAFYLILVCKDHLNALDQKHSRRVKHSIKELTEPVKLLRLESERVIELQAEVKELKKKLKREETVENRDFSRDSK